MKYYFSAWKNYAVVRGRSRRSEFWAFNTVHFAFFAMLFIVNFIVYDASFERLIIILSSLVALPLVLPTITVSIRRLHDTGRNGWWILINLLPVLGTIIFLFMMMEDSNPGLNAYGEYPKFKLYF